MAVRIWKAKWSLLAPEPFEEPAGVALALRRDGVQEGWFDHAGLHACTCQALHALVEEGSRQGTRFARDGDDHAIEVRRAGVADSADGVDGVWAVLSDGEDVHGRTFRGNPGLPEALPVRRSLCEPRIQRGPGEPRPDFAGHPTGEWTLVVHEDAYLGFRHARDVSRVEGYPSPTSRLCKRRKKTSISFTVWRSPLFWATSLPFRKMFLASPFSCSS